MGEALTTQKLEELLTPDRVREDATSLEYEDVLAFGKVPHDLQYELIVQYQNTRDNVLLYGALHINRQSDEELKRSHEEILEELKESDSMYAAMVKWRDDCRDALIQRNMKLVAKEARKKCRSVNINPDEYKTLITDGTIGMMHAIEKYDQHKTNPPTGKPYAFSTYAVWWIMQGITRDGHEWVDMIRKPIHMKEAAWKVKKEYRDICRISGRIYRIEDIAEDIGIALGYPKKKVLLAWRSSRRCTSIEANENGIESMKLQDPTLRLEHEDKYHPNENKEFLKYCLDKLSFRERVVISWRNGLYNGITKTLEAIGSELGVTRERIRQIESVAKKKMRLHGAMYLKKIGFDGTAKEYLSLG